MFSNKLKRPALALAVTAGLLAVAGPASAATTPEPSPSAVVGTINDLIDAAVDKDLNQPDMGIDDDFIDRVATSLAADGNDVLIETIVTSAGADSTRQARSAVLPELDANANAFLPEVNDEVLAGLNYEPDYIEGTQ